jgi:hypothetical protein
VARLPHLLTPAAVAAIVLGGCGGSSSPAPSASPPHRQPSRPGLDGPVLAVLERQDLQFGRHDTLTIGTDGRANLVLAHGGGGFRNATCTFSATELAALRRDLARLPLGRPPRPARHARGHRKPHYDGVIIPKPPLFSVTYRGHRDMFSADAVPAGGAPLERHITRVLDAREGRCRVTFHRP